MTSLTRYFDDQRLCNFFEEVFLSQAPQRPSLITGSRLRQVKINIETLSCMNLYRLTGHSVFFSMVPQSGRLLDSVYRVCINGTCEVVEMQVYPVVFTETKDEKNTVLVYIPDLNGMTEGYGFADAIAMAKNYICNNLYSKVDADFPVPTEITEINPESSVFAGAGKSFVSLVDIDIDSFRRKYKSRNVRRNITLPEWLDNLAAEEKINVSAVTQKALKQKLGLLA